MPWEVRGQKLAGSVGIRRGQGNLLTVEQDWHYRIEAASINQNRTEILYATAGVPQFNVNYNGLFLESADGTRLEDDPLLWDCTYHLSSAPSEGNDREADGTQQTGPPTDWIPLVEIGFEDYEEVLRKAEDIDSGERHPDIGGSDANGYNKTKWTNSAGQPFESGFVRQRRIVTRKFTQFEPSSTTLDTIIGWNDRLNHGTYLTKPKRTLRDSVVLGTYYGTRCWRCDFTLAYKKDDWRLKQLDVGWHYRDSNNKLQPFLDEPGSPIMGALDGQGKKATDQLDPAVLYFKEYEMLDFSTVLRITM
jgi:hypothetical protein